ncbi:MAG: hypothetical protein IKE75_05340 [Bacilli bacterium]|nr:hypothetical protein [Bacilli bacterium]
MKVRINGNNYICDTPLEHLALFKQISDEIDRLKKRKEDAPVINKKSVTIGNYIDKNPLINETEPTRQKLSSTFPGGDYPISSIKREKTSKEYDMYALAREQEQLIEPDMETITRKPKRKVTNYEAYNDLKNERGGIPLIGYDILTKSEIKQLQESPLIFISGNLNHKIETGFYENTEILKGLPTAMFITGKAISPDKILKETAKIVKLSKRINTDIVCYEANNQELREAKDDRLYKAFDAMIGLSEILKEEGYIPLICLDADIRRKLQKLEPNYQIKTPIISRVSSKELDNLQNTEDILVMNSTDDFDELMLTNNTKHYLVNSKKVKTSSR